MINFTQFLESCKCQFTIGKSKEAESFGIVEEGHYVQYSIPTLELPSRKVWLQACVPLQLYGG